MVKKMIDIIPPEGWPADKKPAGLPVADESFGSLARPPLPGGAAGYGIQAKPNIRFGGLAAGPAAEDRFEPASFGGGEKEEKKSFWEGLFWKLALVAALIFGAMWAADAKFAKATVKVWPEVSEAREKLKVGIDTSIGETDRQKNFIPGFAINVEKIVENQTPATGAAKNSQGLARGTVKLFNNYTSPQRLVKGTRLQAPLEKFQPALEGDETPWFKTAEDVLLAPKSSATVGVIAAASGEKYNIEPAVFSVPGLAGTAQYTFIYAQSFEKFAGGSLDRVPEVKKEDLETAKAEIEKFAKVEIQKELEAKIKEEGLEIIDAGAFKFEFGKSEILAKAGDGIAKIPAKINAKAGAIAYKKADLEELGKEYCLSRVPEGSLAKEGSFAFETSYAGIDAETNKPSLELAARMVVYQSMSPEDLKKGLSEKKIEEAKIFLMSQPGTKDAKIDLAPFWRRQVPRALDRIEVQTILD